MLAWLVRLQLVAELLLYGAAGFWLVSARGWTWLGVVVAAVAFALGIRFVIVSLTTTIGWFTRTPRERDAQLGAGATLRYVVGEWQAMLADNFYYLPFEHLALRVDPKSGSGLPVLLVHGYFSNRGIHRGVALALDAAGGGPVFTFNFRRPFAPIEDLARQLDEEVTSVLDRTGAPQLVLVCHSMGGLIARSWLARNGSSRVARLVTIASPHHGTSLARLGVGANARQMRRGSEFLRQLGEAEAARTTPIVATSIYSLHDNLVTPQETSRLAWAKNIAIGGLGHVDILGSPRLHALLVEELREAAAPRRD